MAVFFEGEQYEYTNLVLNTPVVVTEGEQNVDLRGFFSMVISAALIFLVSFVTYVKIQERIYGVPEGRRKKAQG